MKHVLPPLLALLLLVSCTQDDRIAIEEDVRVEGSRFLLDRLATGNVQQRVRAARAMGRTQSPTYVNALFAAASDPEKQVRLAALFALGQLGLPRGVLVHPVSLRPCLAHLQDPDPEIVASTLEAVGKMGHPSTPKFIVPLLEHASARVRAEAALALFRVRFIPVWRGETDSPPELPRFAVTALMERLQDSESSVRRAAAYAFSRYGQSLAVEPLARLLDDGDEWTRLFAARALGRSEDAGAAGPLRAAISDDSAPHVRAEALDALTALGVKPSLSADDPSHHVRAALARALATSTDTATLEQLRRLESDPSPTVRAAALGSLATRLAADYRATLERHLADPLWSIRAAALKSAPKLGEQSAIPLIDLALADPDLRVRVAALESLSVLRPTDPRILEAVDSSDLSLAATAVSLVGKAGFADKMELFARICEDSPGSERIELRQAILESAALLDNPVPLVWRIAREDPAVSIRRRALQLLRGSRKPLPEQLSFPTEPSALLDAIPDREIDVVLETSKGEITIRCLTHDAPLHVASFVKLVNEGFYDGLIWHRVVPNFVIQGGDPRGDGWGGAGYLLRDEINTVRYDRGVVGMPKSGADTGSCQLFITHVPTPHLDGNYTVFGRVVSGIEVVDRIEVGDAIIQARVLQR